MKITKIKPIITTDKTISKEEKEIIKKEALNHIRQRQIKHQLSKISKDELVSLEAPILIKELELLKKEAEFFKQITIMFIEQKQIENQLLNLSKYKLDLLEQKKLHQDTKRENNLLNQVLNEFKNEQNHVK